jgi:hypothetical protein
MHIAPPNTKRVDANPLFTILWKRRRADRDREFVFGKGNCVLVLAAISPREKPCSWRNVANVLLGLGLLNLIFGGMILCSRARTDLMTEVRPDEPSPCPRFGFTEPM